MLLPQVLASFTNRQFANTRAARLRLTRMRANLASYMYAPFATSCAFVELLASRHGIDDGKMPTF